MIPWLNRRQRPIQAVVAVVGLLLVALLLAVNWGQGPANMTHRDLKQFGKGISKPAEVGLFALVGLYAVRRLLQRSIPWKEKAVSLFRLLQIVHIPLAVVVIVAAAIHGGLFTFYLWESDFHYWSGVAALGTMAVVAMLGLMTVRTRRNRTVHGAVALVTFGIALIHIFTT